MKLITLMGSILLCASAAFAQNLPDAPTPKPAGRSYFPSNQPSTVSGDNKTGSYLFFYASAACGSLLAASTNRSRAAEIGVPIYLGLNLVAHYIHPNHPKLSYFLQVVSPGGCYAGGSNRTERVARGGGNGGGNGSGTGTSGGSTGGTGSGSGNGGGSTGSGSGGSNGNGGGTSSGGSGSGSGSGSGGSGDGSGSGGTGSGGGSGSGSGGSGSGGGTGGGGNGNGCIKDCGFPGNGGVNGGNDNNKPPFPGQGNGGSNQGNGNKPVKPPKQHS